ncbi:MAG TPA: hypothetical protein PK156_19535 [Polyangium sp.]|nr:hypothetical protein [Polyangium sp.]
MFFKKAPRRAPTTENTVREPASNPPGISTLDDDDLDIVRGGMVLMNPTNNANAAAHGYAGHRPHGAHRS